MQRVATRWGKTQQAEHNPDLAKMLYALISSLRGSICSYQGEELGLTEADIAFEDLQDPYGVTFWPQFKGRDGCRTPHPWSKHQKNAGFSQVKPWLPISGDHYDKAVDIQHSNPKSVLNSYRKFNQWRKQYPEILLGSIDFIDSPEPILAFIRQYQNKKLLVCFNLSAQATTWSTSLLTEQNIIPLYEHGLLCATVDKQQLSLPAFSSFYAQVK